MGDAFSVPFILSCHDLKVKVKTPILSLQLRGHHMINKPEADGRLTPSLHQRSVLWLLKGT